jgi:hypothetical protein
MEKNVFFFCGGHRVDVDEMVHWGIFFTLVFFVGSFGQCVSVAFFVPQMVDQKDTNTSKNERKFS